jgi:hypothetical protein
MGSEATCQCEWASEKGQCKVLIEPPDLILRGSIRRRVPLSSLNNITAHGDQLVFHVGEDKVSLALGQDLAQSWAKKIVTPPPTLDAKLGITAATHLLLIGKLEGEELQSAISQAASTEGAKTDLILAGVRTAEDLNYALDQYAALSNKPPIWIIYAKGPRKPIVETEIRDVLRREGFMDTKVTSVSATLTALRFIKRT